MAGRLGIDFGTSNTVIAVWDERGSFYGIVERLEQEPLEGDARYLLVNGDTPIDDIVNALRNGQVVVVTVSVTSDFDTPDEAGRVTAGRIVLGHVAPIPWQAKDAAKELTGKAITENVAADAGKAAVQGAKPLSQNGYKVKLAQVAVILPLSPQHATTSASLRRSSTFRCG